MFFVYIVKMSIHEININTQDFLLSPGLLPNYCSKSVIFQILQQTGITWMAWCKTAETLAH